MNPSANGAKTQDPEKFAALSPTTSSDEPRLLTDIKAKGTKTVKMQRLQHSIFALLILAVLSVSFVCSSPDNAHHRKAVPAPPYPQTPPPAIEDPSAKDFQDLLNSVEPASLHEVLHKHLKEKYQHGVYQEDKTAMEMVHQQDAEVARSLIELAKRQVAGSTNGTVATVTPTSTAVVTSTQGTTSTIAPTSTVVAPPSTSTVPQATESSTSVKSVPASSSPSPPASSQGVSTSTAPTQVVSSTSNVVSASTTTAGAKTTTKDNSASSSQTSQGASSSNPVSTTSPGASSTEGSQASNTPNSSDSITQTIVYKTTLANGAQSTVTSVTVVPGQAAERSGGGSGSKTNTANASLQTNGGSQKSFGMNVVVGALGFAAVVAL